jgi:hypothetical protein
MRILEIRYRSTRSGKPQEQAILDCLQAVHGAWVPMPRLMKASGSANVHCRISCLREKGHAIENHQIRAADGTRLSFYRLK